MFAARLCLYEMMWNRARTAVRLRVFREHVRCMERMSRGRDGPRC